MQKRITPIVLLLVTTLIIGYFAFPQFASAALTKQEKVAKRQELSRNYSAALRQANNTYNATLQSAIETRRIALASAKNQAERIAAISTFSQTLAGARSELISSKLKALITYRAGLAAISWLASGRSNAPGGK